MVHNEYLEKIVKLKNNIAIFKDLKDDIIWNMVTDIKFVQYKANEYIIKLGSKEEDIYILLNGECEVLLENDKHISSIKKNQVFGEFSPITKTPRSASVKAKVPCTVLSFKLDFTYIDAQLGGYGILYKNFVTEMIKKLNLMNAETTRGTL